MRYAVLTAVVVERNDLILDRIVYHLGVEFILELLVGERPLLRQHPAGALLVTLDPPAVEYRELQHAVHDALLARSTRSLQRSCRRIEPYVHALHHAARELHVVVLQEDDLAHELRLRRYLYYTLYEILSGLVVRVRLARKDELHGTLLVVDDGRQTLQIREEQVGALVGRKAARETYRQHVGTDSLDDLHHLARRVETYLFGVAVKFTYMVDQPVLEDHALVPQLLVRDLVHALPLGNVIYVTLEALGEVAGIETAQVRCNPCGEVYAVCNVSDVELVLEVSGPHVAQNILRHLAVQPRHAVDLLREVAGQNRHRETLVLIVRVGLAEVDELLPRNAQHVGIVRHVLTHHRLGEGIVAGRYGRVGREQRRRTHHLQSLREGQTLLGYKVADTLDADKGGMALVAVVDLLTYSHLRQRADTAHTQQQLLLETVLPVAAVEIICNLAILLEVCLVVRIEQEELRTAHLTLPYACRERTARESDLYRHPVAHVVTHGRDGQLEEVLRLVRSHLTALRRELLREVSVTVEKAHGHHRVVLVRSLLEVVAGEDTQTARVDLQRRVQAVLHREVCDLGACRIGLLGHVLLELRAHRIQTRKELAVLLQLVYTLDREFVDQGYGVTLYLVPEFGVDALEQVARILRPAPPQVSRDGLQSVQTRRQTLLDHHAVPRRLVRDELLAHEVDLLGIVSAVAHRTVRTGHSIVHSLGVCPLVVYEELVPQGQLRHLARRAAHLLDLLVVELYEPQRRIHQLFDGIGVVIVVTADNLDTRMVGLLHGPESESREVRRHRRYRECDRLKRRVAPRLIV